MDITRLSQSVHKASPQPSSVVVLVGPTASGKTEVSLRLASILRGEILSADSRQVYRYLDIGTAKPTPAERRSVRHYFVDELDPDQDFNAGEFGKRGREILRDIMQRGNHPIVVGGSGLYVRALIDGFFEGPSADKELRSELYAELHARGSQHLYDRLRAVDPDSASRMLPSNTRRIIRALEVYVLTGTPISQLHLLQNTTIDVNASWFGLQWKREELYNRINGRVDRMMEKGLLHEVKMVLEQGYAPSLNALQTVGYRELIEHLQGKYSLTEAIDLIKRNSRRYAKRQMTWFRQEQRIEWIPISSLLDLQTASEYVLRTLKLRNKE